MEENNTRKDPAKPIVSTYTSVITKDGDLTLPEACLAEFTPQSSEHKLAFVLSSALREDSINLYTQETFDKIREALDDTDPMDPNMRTLRRVVLGRAIEVTPDKKGRIRIAPAYLMRLGLHMDQDSPEARTEFPVKILTYPGKIEIRKA